MISGYRLMLVSSVGERDGMSIELDLVDGTQIAEVFEDYDTGQRTLHLFIDHVPIDAIEWLLEDARNTTF